jgi:hypothetical protein
MSTVLDRDHLTAFLASLPGRCTHGYHATQGCPSCAPVAPASEWTRVEVAVRQAAATGRVFSANDVRDQHGVKGGVVGRVFKALQKDGVIKPDDGGGDPLVRSGAPSTNGHHIFKWVGVAAA